MTEPVEKLQGILGDEGGLDNLLKTAAAMLGQPQQPEASVPLPSLPAAPNGNTGAPDINRLLGNLFGSTQAASDAPANTAASSGVGALPDLLQMFSGKANYIDENRLNLIRAIKPYMAETKAGSIDRAIKMANIAKAAKKALGILGR